MWYWTLLLIQLSAFMIWLFKTGVVDWFLLVKLSYIFLCETVNNNIIRMENRHMSWRIVRLVLVKFLFVLYVCWIVDTIVVNILFTFMVMDRKIEKGLLLFLWTSFRARNLACMSYYLGLSLTSSNVRVDMLMLSTPRFQHYKLYNA